MAENDKSEISLSLKPVRRGQSLVDEVLTQMRSAIVQGDWELGAKISEARVALELGVSKTPVREALLQLKREGLVAIRPQSGTFVFTLAPGELNQICEMRWVLESAALRRAFEIGGHDSLAEKLRAICAAMARARAVDDTRHYLDLDGAFHRTICTHGENPYLIQSYELLEGKVAALRTHLGTDPHHLEKSFDEHQRIAESLAHGGLEDTIGLLARHIARKEGSYWEHIDQTDMGLIHPPGEGGVGSDKAC